MTELEKLLNAIKEIVDREKTLQEAKRTRGENFNIFNVLGVSTSEVKLHSDCEFEKYIVYSVNELMNKLIEYHNK